jgi:HD superfamily phosphohydrolase
MPDRWPKSIRDAVHGMITFHDRPLDRLLWRLIHAKEFQRLRRIKQLGFSDMIFPGATQTRFAHSLGVMWLVGRFLDRLSVNGDDLVSEEQRIVVTISALMHDIGHGPFSHAFEQISKVHHELRTAQIILDDDTEIGQILRDADLLPDLDKRVAKLFPKGEAILQEKGDVDFDCPAYLVAVLSGQIDADRADYLLRDSHSTGTGYGRFSLDRLVDHLHADPEYGVLFFSTKVRHEIESYVFARYHMYQAVYYHKATRSAEVMLRLYFRRLKELIELGDRADLPSYLPDALRRLATGEGSLADFLSLDDHSISEVLRGSEVSRDTTLSYLASGLLHRRLYKCADSRGSAPHVSSHFEQQARDLLNQTRDRSPVLPEYALACDTPNDTPYRVVYPEDDRAAQVLLGESRGDLRPIHELSDVVDALKSRISQLRFYFPPELRESIDEIALREFQAGG